MNHYDDPSLDAWYVDNETGKSHYGHLAHSEVAAICGARFQLASTGDRIVALPQPSPSTCCRSCLAISAIGT